MKTDLSPCPFCYSSTSKAVSRSKLRPDESATALAYGSNSISNSEDPFAVGPKMSEDGREPSEVFSARAFASLGRRVCWFEVIIRDVNT